MEDDVQHVRHLMLEYFMKFNEYPPVLPMMISPTAPWYVTLLLLSISTNEKLKQEDLDEYIRKNNIKYDLIDDDFDSTPDSLTDIDVDEIFANSSNKSKDPDKYSKRLGKIHCILWNSRNKLGNLEWNPLNRLKTTINGMEYVFTPDSITNSFRNSDRLVRGLNIKEKDAISNYGSKVQTLVDEYAKTDYTIGSSIIFPISIGGVPIGYTMNKARGLNQQVHDRFDYTLECIKRYYDKNTNNPLQSALEKSSAFFDIFNGFDEYVHFFFLEDLIDRDGNVISFTNKIDFDNPFPTNKDDYYKCLSNTMEFVKKRNKRIQDWCKQKVTGDPK